MKNKLNPDAAPKPYFSKKAFIFWTSIILAFIIYLLIRFIIAESQYTIYFIISFIILGGLLISILRLGLRKKIVWYFSLLDEDVYCPKCNNKMDYVRAEEFLSSYRHGTFRCSECQFELVKGYTHWEEVQLMITLTAFAVIAMLWFMLISLIFPDVRQSLLGM